LRENFDRFNFAIHKEKEMADFRRWILAFALLVLVLGAVAPASAQTGTAFQCTANAAVPPTIRQEGLTELVGDIVLNCTGGIPTPTGTPIPQANITVSFAQTITSRVLATVGTINLTEALLLVDEPNPAVGQIQDVCPDPTNPIGTQASGTGCAEVGSTPPGASFATNGDYNVYQGTMLSGSPSTVTFLGVPIDPPGTALTRVYRMTNIRISPGLISNAITPIYAFISASSSTSVPINNPAPIVAFVEKGLNASATGTGTPFLQCETTTGFVNVGTVSFAENFATAFKYRVAQGSPLDTAPGPGLQYTPGAIYNTESGLVLAASSTANQLVGLAGGAGLADWGSRFYATISNIPAGVDIEVDDASNSTSGTGRAVLVSSATVADPGPYGLAVDPNPGTIAQTDVTSSVANGSVTVYWEVISENPVALDTFNFNIYVEFTGTPGTTPLTVAPTVVLGWAPNTSTGSPVGIGIPTFTLGATSPTTLFTVSPCQTILLFPYVTDFGDFDTGVAISNTSEDNLGSGGASSALNQTGACTVTFYGGYGTNTTFTNTSTNLGTVAGSNVLSSTDPRTNNFGSATGQIAPGQTWTFSVSGIDSTHGQTGYLGFTGYAIAVCDFQYAHGYAFVSDYGINRFATAYLALIIPDAPRTATPFTTSAAGEPGEQLVH
jgi:hypothetical protein